MYVRSPGTVSAAAKETSPRCATYWLYRYAFPRAKNVRRLGVAVQILVVGSASPIVIWEKRSNASSRSVVDIDPGYPLADSPLRRYSTSDGRQDLVPSKMPSSANRFHIVLVPPTMHRTNVQTPCCAACGLPQTPHARAVLLTST